VVGWRCGGSRLLCHAHPPQAQCTAATTP
jgi:hypothetical protein